MGINKFIGIGNLGKDPEVRKVNDTSVASFSVGISEKWTSKSGEKKESTEWINCTAWGNLAVIVEKYLKKGSKVYLEGKLKTDSYEKEGRKVFSTKVNVTNLQMLDGRPTSAVNEPIKSNEDTDDLPFN